MNEQAQRIAIATFVGWQAIELRDSVISGKKDWLSGLNPKPDEIVKVIDAESGEERAPNESDYGYETLPDYLRDLNAIHEAEKLMSEAQQKTYAVTLAVEMGFANVFATATTKAEFLLKAIKEWRD